MRAHFVVLLLWLPSWQVRALCRLPWTRGGHWYHFARHSKIKGKWFPHQALPPEEKSVDEGDEERVSTSQFSSVEKVLEKLPSLEKKEILDGVNQLSHADKAALTKRLASLERLEISLDTGKVPGIIKKFSDSKLVRLMQYNVWIQCKKTPEWVETNYPAFAKGFDTFYHNRMTPGYKYA
ncbi:hypothetical protein GQ600_1411 [Phytophthora cactorum]|nr:hypothetical protein GQ600_1411 [Phytophthora cactorum]